MRKDQEEALRRLEAALMEAEEEIPADETEFLDDTWAELSNTDYDIYNTDDTDVDLTSYSEEVHRGRRSGALSVVLTLLTLLALSAAILWLLRFMGVL